MSSDINNPDTKKLVDALELASNLIVHLNLFRAIDPAEDWCAHTDSLWAKWREMKRSLVGHMGCSGCMSANEKLADAYIRLSGKKIHASDCATSCAPAETPGECDCNVQGETARP